MPRVRSDIERGESLPVPLPPVQQKYLSLEGYTVSNPECEAILSAANLYPCRYHLFSKSLLAWRAIP